MSSGVSINPDSHSGPRAAAEAVFVIGCVVFAEWAAIPLFGKSKTTGMICMCIVFLFGGLSHRARRETAEDIGFGLQNFWEALRLLLLWMIPAAAVLVAIGWTLGSLHFRFPGSWGALAKTGFWLFLWGLMQQYALQAIINRRFQDIWGKGGRSVLAAALIFSALHMPNLWLTVATLLGGFFWAWSYQKTPNLWALAISHSVMTVVLASSLSTAMLHGLRVGYNYF